VPLWIGVGVSMGMAIGMAIGLRQVADVLPHPGGACSPA
jgi:hypothetical protein